MAKHNDTGREAEKIALGYLKNKNYNIRELNWKHGHKEIDIIAEFNGKLIIVEVKSCNESNEETASNLLTLRKMRNMVDAAEAYILRMNLRMEVRFDMFLVVFGVFGIKVQHIPGAFIPGVNW